MPEARDDLLVWIDMEMSGLDVTRERVLELAVLVTDGDLREVAEGPELVLHQSDEVLGAMDAWNTEHHGASGLVDAVRASRVDEAQAERLVLDFLRAHCVERSAPLAGNSVWNDRLFLRRWLPRVDAYLHYRIVDVSSVKELVRRWQPEVFARLPQKREAHRALGDIRESIAELAFYRREAFR